MTGCISDSFEILRVELSTYTTSISAMATLKGYVPSIRAKTISQSCISFYQANVLVDDSGQPKLCDSGLTTVTRNGTTGGSASSALKGSLRYMAPEFLRNEHAVRTKKSDVWAWTCLGLEVSDLYGASMRRSSFWFRFFSTEFRTGI